MFNLNFEAMKYAAAFIITLFLFSCGNEDRSEEIKNTNEQLISSIQSKNMQINSLVKSLKEIRTSINGVKTEQGLLLANETSFETPLSMKNTIVNDIEILQRLIEDSKWDINSLEESLANGNAKNAELKVVLGSLKLNLAEKDKDIRQLKEQIFDWDACYKHVNDILNEKVVESELMRQEMNKVYFACGTFKELKGKGVVEKKGSIFGALGSKDLKDNFNKTYFTEGDLREITDIPIMAKKLEIVTPHHDDSYLIEMDKDNVITKLVITDKERFWDASKFLTIVVNQ
ncbi:MAG: hypothetical protein HKN39_02570 [Flavobacteriales bacterium]|nr:hypothetical protein [Flavobacteriales bacterium]